MVASKLAATVSTSNTFTVIEMYDLCVTFSKYGLPVLSVMH